MLRTYPLDPPRQPRQAGLLVIIARHGSDLAASGGQARTPATRTHTGAGLLLATSSSSPFAR
jgi:hypothetical protein